jgi:2-polyprenyl-6-methoxyphenol hydroxylase-like FAD-dependent oxidoreductase
MMPTPAATIEPQTTTCVVVGGGPAGAMLALLLARRGVNVRLLEAHRDFERAFRGDSIYPTVLEVMGSLGLGERLHALPHARAQTIRVVTEHGPITIGSFGRLRGRFPYLMIVPQSRFIEFVIEEAKRYPNFSLEFGARVEAVLEDHGGVRGVRYRQDGVIHELQADLTVGCDGRGSRVRALSGLESGLVSTTPATDLLWLSVPRQNGSTRQEVDLHVGHGHYLAILEHAQHWQVGYGIPKGQFRTVREAGLESLRASIAKLAPWLAGPLEGVTGWSQIQLLSVQTSRLKRWAKPGLLLIGDAAHTMSPMGGVGINLAIQDAVVATNCITTPLLEHRLNLRDLQAVQRERDWPVRFTQAWTRILEKQLALSMKSAPSRFVIVALRSVMSIPVMSHLLTWIIAYGLRPPRVLKPSPVEAIPIEPILNARVNP